jgi:Glycosyl hydrolases family 28
MSTIKPDNTPWTRRNWLGLMTTASLGSGLFAAADAAAQSPAGSAQDSKLAGARIYNIRDFGAKGDSATLDTAALQAAIDACHKDQGGIVLVPAGVFTIGTVEMKSNVTLRLAAAATLLGTADGTQYHAADAIPLDGEHTMGDGNVGLIFAANAENITIEGPGTIDGQGAQFRSPTRGVPPPSGISGHRRPYHLLFYQCKHLTVRDIFLKDCAYHSLRVCVCRYVKLDGIHIHSRILSNNDGFHFISSQYVHLSNCDVECGDDACALFGSCKFVTVTNCTFSTRWSVFRFGGGEAENIVVSNCIIYQTYGCPIKLRCGSGSRYENMSFSNIIMKDVTGPISIGLGPQRPQPGAPPETPGIVRNISFNGIQATVSKPAQLPDAPYAASHNPGEVFSAIILNGMDEGFLENISFNDVHVTFPGGGTAEQAARRDVPKIAGEYYAIGVPPAYGLFARNVRGLTLQNVRFQLAAPDLRPAMVFDHVEDAAVNGFGAQGNPEAESLLRFIETREVLLTAGRVLTPASVFLQVEGAASNGITVDGGDLSRAKAPLAFHAGASATAVRLRA